MAERDGRGGKWEWQREREREKGAERLLKKKKIKIKTFIIRFPNLLSPFHPSTISSTAGSQSLGEAGPTVLQWGNLHSLMPRLSLVTLNLILAAGTQNGPTRKGSAAWSNRRRFMCVVIRPGRQRWQMRTFQRGLCQDTKLLSTSAFSSFSSFGIKFGTFHFCLLHPIDTWR